MTTPVTLAVDLGGTRLRSALVAADGTIRDRVVIPTPHSGHCLDPLLEVVATVERSPAGRECSISSVVVGVPGRVDYTAGRLEYAPNLPQHWAEELDEESLSAALGRPVMVANDGDMAAVGEAGFGAGRGFRDVVYVTYSTGVGAGVVIDGRLVRARRSLAEIGHTLLSGDVSEGSATSVEDLGSGTALARGARAAGLQVEGAELVALVEAGDPVATAVFHTVASAVAASVVNLAHLFSPEVIVIGGGLGRNLHLLGGPVAAALERFGPKGLPEPIVVRQAALGDDSGLVGGAGWITATS